MKVQDAARIFTSGEISRLAHGDFSYVNRVAKEFLLVDPIDAPVSEIFERAYSVIEKKYRYEYVYKNAIANKILLGRHSTNTATMLSEFRVGKNIADCVIINGFSTCYEIKTEFDSLLRLKDQLDSYNKLFDKTYVVTDEKYLHEVEKTTPSHVGVILLTKRNTLSVVREAGIVADDYFSIPLAFDSMRAEEYKRLTYNLSGSIPDVGNINMFDACREVVLGYSNQKVKDEFKNVIKKSRKNKDSFLSSLPRSLKNIAISYKLSVSAQHGLLKNLKYKEKGNSYVLSSVEG